MDDLSMPVQVQTHCRCDECVAIQQVSIYDNSIQPQDLLDIQ